MTGMGGERDAGRDGEDVSGEDPPQLAPDIELSEGADLPAGEAQDRRGPEPPDEALLPPDAG